MRPFSSYWLSGLSVALVLLVATAAPAEDRITSFEVEARLLDGEIAAYADVRARERGALDELQRLNRLLDDTLADPNAAPPDLLSLETEVAVARDGAFAASRESGERRAAMYERMRGLARLAQEYQRLVASGDRVDGSWRIEAQAGDLWGLFDLAQEGSLVSGSYRLSNGARGSARGTFAGQRLDLELVDSERGPVADLWGELDPESGEIRGSWQARELGSGRPGAGHWSAQRVSPLEAPTAEP